MQTGENAVDRALRHVNENTAEGEKRMQPPEQSFNAPAAWQTAAKTSSSSQVCMVYM